MHKALPVMIGETNTLKQRISQAQHGRKKPRLQMLYLLASGQAHTRQGIAQWLGVHRHTVGHWLALDEAGGLSASLEVYVPAGKPVSLPADVLGGLEQALRRLAGFASDEALRQWVKQRFQLVVRDHTRDTIVCTRFRATLKVPRPQHTQKS